VSLCRHSSDCDLYIYEGDRGYVCSWCALQPNCWSNKFATVPALLAHVREHRAAGHKVPAYVIEALEAGWPS